MLGKGRAAALGVNDFAIIADEIKCHPSHLEAIAQAESAGFGWFKDGRMKILPEPHKFNTYLPKSKRATARKLGLATVNYKATRRSGHYRRMKGPGPRYDLFRRMIDYDRHAAFMAVSYGTYQPMGFNHTIGGYATAEAMFNAFLESERNQLDFFIAFLRKKRLVTAIREGNWNRIEKGYNGGGQGGAYARIMARNARKLKAGKWKGYKPGDRKPEKRPQKPVREPDPPPVPQPKPTPKKPPQPAKSGLFLGIIALIVGGVTWFACKIPFLSSLIDSCGG